MSLNSDYEKKLLEERKILMRKMIAAMNRAIEDISAYLVRYAKKFPDDYSKRITYINRMGIKRQVMAQLKQLVREEKLLGEQGAEKAWNLAVQKNNIIARQYITGATIPVALAKSMFANNQAALVSYLKNTSKISERVLNYTGLYQQQIENYLSSGIIQGKSAREIATALKAIAQDPMAAFKAMKKLHPEAILEMPKPGQGVYQSVYKNLLRLARTEINISFRLSDYEKRKEAPFVVGFEVHLSAAHPVTDICDAMEGSYPVEFIFCGWHPNCLCYTTDILADKDEFKAWVKRGMPNEPIQSQKSVTRIPLAAERYVLTHHQKLEGQYFYRDNFSKGKPLKEVGGARKDLKPYQVVQKDRTVKQNDKKISRSK